MSKEELDIFLEAVNIDYQEAVLDKQISPAARAEVRKQRELHRKKNVKPMTKKELHSASPLDPRKQRAFNKEAGKKTSGSKFIYYNYDMETSESEGGFDPDDLWKAAKENKNMTLPFIWIRDTDELVYISMADQYNEDKYNMLNYDRENPNNPLKMNPLRWERGPYDRTHSDIFMSIEGLIHNGMKFKKGWKFYNELERKYIDQPRPKMIMGRYYNKMVSFWNSVEEELAEKILQRLKKHNQIEWKNVYIPSKTILQR